MLLIKLNCSLIKSIVLSFAIKIIKHRISDNDGFNFSQNSCLRK